MVQGDIVKRIWSKNSQISEHNDILNIWDTGSHIYERWPNGDEFYWKVVSREETESGIIETLEKMPPWETPGQVIRKEQIAMVQFSASHFQLGSWSVEQVSNTPCNQVVLIQEGRKQKKYYPHFKKKHMQSRRQIQRNYKYKN